MAAEAQEEETPQYFACTICGLKEKFHFYGSKPPFEKSLNFPEDVYLMKDPFQPRNSKASMNFLVLGSNCSLCSNSVCVDSACSIFYSKRFCRGCALEKYHRFPIEIQKEIEKMQSTAQVEQK